jgi:hypothetical protein
MRDDFIRDLFTPSLCLAVPTYHVYGGYQTRKQVLEMSTATLKRQARLRLGERKGRRVDFCGNEDGWRLTNERQVKCGDYTFLVRSHCKTGDGFTAGDLVKSYVFYCANRILAGRRS